LPLTYNRDMQEDKEAIFDSVDTAKAALEIFAEMINGARFRAEATGRAAADPALLATDLADRLVLGGVPFRQAHEIVGKLVAVSAQKNVPLDQLDPADYLAASPVLQAGTVKAVFNLAAGLSARGATGAPSPKNLAKRLAHWKKRLR
ncbi:MAG: argininosuccinate lyase, partial [Terrimicrobiaceae bacterium]